MRRFIAIAEKELELYHRHVALYGDPNNRNPLSILEGPSGNSREEGNHGEEDLHLSSDGFSAETEADSTEMELSETEDDFKDGNLSMNELGSEEEDRMLDSDEDQGREVYFTKMKDESVCSIKGSSSMSKHGHHYNNQYLLSEQIPITRD